MEIATKQTKGRSPRLLVIDDDPLFGLRIARMAKKGNIPVTYCKSIYELKGLNKNDYDVILIDYYLDNTKGTELASIMGATPVIMMSNLPDTCLEENTIWPSSVRKFISKRAGIPSILMLAKQQFERLRT